MAATTPRKNLGYMFQNGLGVQTDYARAMSWYVEAAAHGNSNAENQLGWMYQHGQGVEPDDARALTWYQLAADQGNMSGKRNLDILTADLEDTEAWQSATAHISDAAIERAQRWAKIDDLQRRIAGLEGDAQNQDVLPTNSNILAKAKTTQSPSSSMRPAASPLPSTISRRKSIAPKRRACAKNLLNSKTNLDRLPASLLPNVFPARVPERGFVFSRYWGSHDLRDIFPCDGQSQIILVPIEDIVSPSVPRTPFLDNFRFADHPTQNPRHGKIPRATVSCIVEGQQRERSEL